MFVYSMVINWLAHREAILISNWEKGRKFDKA